MKRIWIGLFLLVFGFGGLAVAGPYDDAIKAERRADYVTAFRLLMPLARQGIARAQYRLGRLYARGRGVDRNYREAAKWYGRAANKGYGSAQVNLGSLYISGKGVPKNFTRAAGLFRKAANNGNIGAQYLLGVMYRKGSGVRKDRFEAAKWFRKAASMGQVNAQFNLGFLYNQGQGVRKDYRRALKWFRLAANQKHAPSMGMLGLHYKAGWGVQKSSVRAYMWYTLGARYGSKSSIKARARLVRRMTRQQISTASILAKHWKPRSDGLIKISQQLLTRLGYDVGVATGLQGGRTRLAIVSYQRDRGLAVTGRVSARLIKLMVAELGGNVPSTANVGRQRPPPRQAFNQPRPRVNSSGRTGQFAARPGRRPANRFDNRRRARPRTSTGTGFVVSKAGHILTNRHVVNRCKSVKIRWADGDEGVAKILSISKNADLALLKTTSKVIKVAKFRSGKRLRQGEDIAVYGFPLTGILSASGNLTTGSVAALAGLRDNASLMQISAPVQPGNSGGPVFDTFGRIVGVVVSKLNAVKISRLLKDIPQNINFAIKGSVATNFLEARGVPYEIEAGGVKRSNADNTDDAKRYTVRIHCTL